MKRWGKRFLSSTRGRVVELLRRGSASVNELAESVGVTDNAIRSHLTTLERDGLVQEAGKRPGVRKPETLYELTSQAEQLFPKAYHLLFNQLLTVLAGRFSRDEMEDILLEVGHRLALDRASSRPQKNLRERVEDAVVVLKNLGGLAELDDVDDGYLIRGYSCPIAAAVEEHPEACQLAEALLSDIVGAPIREVCERDGTPRCRFLVATNGA